MMHNAPSTYCMMQNNLDSENADLDPPESHIGCTLAFLFLSLCNHTSYRSNFHLTAKKIIFLILRLYYRNNRFLLLGSYRARTGIYSVCGKYGELLIILKEAI